MDNSVQLKGKKKKKNTERKKDGCTTGSYARMEFIQFLASEKKTRYSAIHKKNTVNR